MAITVDATVILSNDEEVTYRIKLTGSSTAEIKARINRFLKPHDLKIKEMGKISTVYDLEEEDLIG